MGTCRTSRGQPCPPPLGRGGPAARAEAAEGARRGRPHSQGGGQRLPLQKVSEGSHLFHEEMRAVDLPTMQEVVLVAVACADPPEVESCCAQGDEEIFPTDLACGATPRWPGPCEGRRGRISAGGFAPCQRACPANLTPCRCGSNPALFGCWGRHRTPARRCGLWWRRPRAGELASPRAPQVPESPPPRPRCHAASAVN